MGQSFVNQIIQKAQKKSGTRGSMIVNMNCGLKGSDRSTCDSCGEMEDIGAVAKRLRHGEGITLRNAPRTQIREQKGTTPTGEDVAEPQSEQR